MLLKLADFEKRWFRLVIWMRYVEGRRLFDLRPIFACESLDKTRLSGIAFVLLSRFIDLAIGLLPISGSAGS